MASPAGTNAISPFAKTRRPRGKYSSKVCVQCRRRKLKCSGDEPCQRCARGGKSCLFSDDPNTIAELARRDSHVTPHRPSPSMSETHPAHVHGQPATPLDMEARINRMESTLQSIVQLIPHGNSNDRNSVEPQQADDNEGFRGDTAFQAPVDAFNANLASLREQLGYRDAVDTPPSSWQRADVRLGSTSAPTTSSTDSAAVGFIQFGSRNLPFPTRSEYARYLDFVFEDINVCHPCLNEADFRFKCQSLQESRVAKTSDACLLATNYILFACVDILTHVGPVQEKDRLPGWQWYVAADNLMGKRKISGRGDLGLIQFLVYEAFYLSHADKANAAYNVSGLACRLCFQFGLHQERLWGSGCTEYSRHMRQRLFWTVYFVDRRIALSCGRPYGIRDSDIQVEQPRWLEDKALHPDRPLPEPDPDRSSIGYLCAMIAFARFAGEVWDRIFSIPSPDDAELGERIAILDARIRHWLDVSLPLMPLLPQGSVLPSQRHLRQQSLVRTRMNHLRLLLRRRAMVSLAYTATDGLVCGQVATEIVRDMQTHVADVEQPSSFRFHMAITLGGAIIILATLLCRDLSTVGLQEYRPAYVESYHVGISMLRDLAGNLHPAGRILQDMRHIINVAELVLQGPSPGATQDGIFTSVVPANLDDLFPYGGLDQTVNFSDDDMGAFGNVTGNALGPAGPVGSTVLDQGMTLTWDAWDDMLLRTAGSHGVPWV